MFVQCLQLFEFVRQFDFKAAAVGVVEADACHFRRQVALSGGVGLWFVVRVAVACAVAFVFVDGSRRVAQVQRYGVRRVIAHVLEGGFHRLVAGVAFRCEGEVGDGLGERQVAFRRAEALVGLVGV